MSKRIGFFIITILMVVTVGILSVPVTYAATGDIQPDLEDQMVTLVNQARVSNGLNPLTVHDGVRTIARSRSADMAIRNYFSHYIPPEGRTSLDLLYEAGIGRGVGAENLARNTAPRSQAVQVAFDSLMASPGHRANILKGNYTHIGIGAAEGNSSPWVWYFTQVFIDGTTPTLSTLSGYVIKADIVSKDCFFDTTPYPNVTLTLSGISTNPPIGAYSSEGGYYEFSGLTAGTKTLSLSNFTGKVLAILTRMNGNWVSYTDSNITFTVPPDERITFCIDTSAP